MPSSRQRCRCWPTAWKRFTVFELRAGLVQDVLPPPSILAPGDRTPGATRQRVRATGIAGQPAEHLEELGHLQA